jgi:hypothetical protein
VASETSTDAEGATQESVAKRRKWHQRPTIRALKHRAVEQREFPENWDRRDNEETRLPATEAVHLGGLVLTEAFTPSSVSALYKALEELPIDRPDLKQEWLAELTRSRRGASGGWRNLGAVRRPSSFIMGDGFHDAALAEGVEAVWLHLSYATPSLALLVATFTITEGAGDLSALLRKDYHTRPLNVRVRVYGRGAALRQKCPWARPARHGLWYNISRAEDQKRLACEAVIRRHEEACSRWFADRFPGRFAASPNSRDCDAPVVHAGTGAIQGAKGLAAAGRLERQLGGLALDRDRTARLGASPESLAVPARPTRRHGSRAAEGRRQGANRRREWRVELVSHAAIRRRSGIFGGSVRNSLAAVTVQ